MKVVEDKGGAIALMIIALLFLGTWPALLNLLERRGRNPVHTYLDYSFTNFLMAIIVALTLGQIGDAKVTAPNFTDQLKQVGWAHRLCLWLVLSLSQEPRIRCAPSTPCCIWKLARLPRWSKSS